MNGGASPSGCVARHEQERRATAGQRQGGRDAQGGQPIIGFDRLIRSNRRVVVPRSCRVVVEMKGGRCVSPETQPNGAERRRRRWHETLCPTRLVPACELPSRYAPS